MKYDENMDAECIPLCDALNLLPGIKTFESCCGHGEKPFAIHFIAETLEALHPICVGIHERPWVVEIAWASGSDNLYCTLRGTVGAYVEANSLAFALDQRI